MVPVTEHRSAHLSGWARIETIAVAVGDFVDDVAPTFRGGRGLKRQLRVIPWDRLR